MTTPYFLKNQQEPPPRTVAARTPPRCPCWAVGPSRTPWAWWRRPRARGASSATRGRSTAPRRCSWRQRRCKRWLGQVNRSKQAAGEFYNYNKYIVSTHIYLYIYIYISIHNNPIHNMVIIPTIKYIPHGRIINFDIFHGPHPVGIWHVGHGLPWGHIGNDDHWIALDEF